MKQNLYELAMGKILEEDGYPYEIEYKFHPKRKWRFDFVLKPIKTKIAIEVNGGHWIKGRHNHGNNYVKDLEKLNTAQLMGWIVLQYVPDNLADVVKDLEILKQAN